MTENVSPEMVGRMIALVRSMANGGPSAIRRSMGVYMGPLEHLDEAKAIAASFTVPTDPDLPEAQRIVCKHFRDGTYYDSGPEVQSVLEALKSRTLATQGDR